MEGIEEITLQITDELLNIILAILSKEVRLKQVNVTIRTNETEYVYVPRNTSKLTRK